MLGLKSPAGHTGSQSPHSGLVETAQQLLLIYLDDCQLHHRQPEAPTTHSMLGLSTYVLRMRCSRSGWTIALLMGADAAMQRGSASVLPRLNSLICFSCPAAFQ